MIRPSSLPMLAQCPRFESGGERDFATEGTARHDALAALLRGDETLVNALDEDGADGVRWAADYIKLHAPLSDHPLEIERRCEYVTDDFDIMRGTFDYACGPELFDFKWRERDYEPQLAAYAATRAHCWPRQRIHILFGEPRRAHPPYWIDEASARAVVEPIVARASDPNAQPTPCDYCGWCAHRLTCKPYTRTAKRVAEGYADEPLLSQVKNWHPSEVTTADEMGLMLTIARKLLVPWCKSVEFRGKEMAEKDGIPPTGFELKPKKGKSYITNVATAHELLALPVEDFLKCCDLRLNTSKKYPDKTGVIDVYAKVKELKKAPAGREVKQKLSEVITTGKQTMSLVAVGGDDTEEGEE